LLSNLDPARVESPERGAIAGLTDEDMQAQLAAAFGTGTLLAFSTCATDFGPAAGGRR
jgi:hypothetical protein